MDRVRTQSSGIPALLRMIPRPIGPGTSFPSAPLPRPQAVRIRPPPASGSCRTGSRLPTPSRPQCRWRKPSGRPPRTSASATVARHLIPAGVNLEPGGGFGHRLPSFKRLQGHLGLQGRGVLSSLSGNFPPAPPSQLCLPGRSRIPTWLPVQPVRVRYGGQ